MFKIAILGCENSHANQFLSFVIKDKKYTDIEFVGVYSDDIEAATELAKEFGVYVMESYDEFIGKVDGIIVTARHGDNHLKYAKPYMESGIPMFIDKPITVSEADAIELKTLAQKNNVRLSGGSVLKLADGIGKLKAGLAADEYGKVYGGFLRAPISMHNDYGNFFFYAQHLVSMMCELFGLYPNSVFAVNNNDIVTCTVRYDAYDVIIQFTEGNYDYFASVSAEKGMFTEKLTLDGTFQEEFAKYYDILTGKQQKESYEDFIAQVFILNAIDRSLKSGKEEKVNRQ